MSESVKRMKELAEEAKRLAEGMSEDELSQVAGGKDCYCFLGGGGTGGSNSDTCACVAAGYGFFDTNTGNHRCFCPVGGYGDDK